MRKTAILYWNSSWTFLVNRKLFTNLTLHLGVNNLVDDAMGLIDGLRKTGLDKDLLNMNSLIDTVYLQIVLIYFKKF